MPTKKGYDRTKEFWLKVDKNGPTPIHRPELGACWVWTASVDKYGYGKASTGKRSRWEQAHRVSWKINHGEIPNGMCVCHRCDNPACVRDEHLFLGTKKENSRDMASKGRQGLQKIKISEHAEIRRRRGLGETLSRIASDYGVTYGAIWFIVNPGYISPRYRKAA